MSKIEKPAAIARCWLHGNHKSFITPEAAYAIDQFVMGGGKILPPLCQDGACHSP